MRRPQRLIAAAILVAFSGVLGGCSSGFGAGWDPSDLLDFLDTKKKLPGERKPVFPDGVPGLDQGVPKDLYKGAQQQQDDPSAQAAVAPPPQQPLEPPPGSKQALKKAKARQQQAPAATAAAPADQPAEADGETAAASQEDALPPPPKKKIVRKRTTAPPQDQPAQAAPQATQSAFPAPLPGGTFTR
jgi:hypothetical protein